MDKRGSLWLVMILAGLILIVILLLSLNFFRYYLEAKTLGKQLKEKNITYYLPSEFAVIKIERGYFEAEISGIKIFFKDDNKNKYYYESSNYPRTSESKQYIIIKDELNPEVPINWDFSKVKQISFAFVFPNNRTSREVYQININQNSTESNFKGQCFSANESGGGKIICN